MSVGPELYFAAMGLGLIVYALTAGADFGGGVWDLFARGPRKMAQRRVVEDAIAPIWEANHVWLIFVVVVMFTIFPKAFSTIGTALHIPITLALIGIVLRGAAFTFRAYGMEAAGSARNWGRVFSLSSVFTPVLLGVCLGALSTGDIRLVDGRVASGFLAGWLTPFAWLVGLLSLALFALLAAVYLTAESDGEVQEDFRRRALFMEGLAFVVAFAALFAARADAPMLFERLTGSPWTIAMQAATASAALTTVALLWTRRPHWARWSVAAQVALVVLGWGLAMDGHLVYPDLPFTNAGARPEIMAILPPALAVGTALLAPSLWLLFKVFKARKRPA